MNNNDISLNKIMDAAVLPPRTKKNYDYCVVKGCDSTASKLELHFHRFPKPNECVVSITNAFGKVEQVDKLKAWKIALKINNITCDSKVCSQHFRKSDYILPDISTKRMSLKKTAVPFRFDRNAEKNKSRLERRLRRATKNESVVHTPVEIIPEENDLNINSETSENTEMSVNNKYTELDSVSENNQLNEQVNIESFIRTSTPAPLFKDFGMQVNVTEIQRQRFYENIETDSELSTVTGIESFQVLNTIVQIVEYAKVDTQKSVKMSLKERVIMTFFKLKQNVSYSLLAVIFKCYSVKHCLRIFKDTIKMLSLCLKPAIVWPSREEIRRNLPECFESFEDVRVVLDCTEIFIQRPAELCCQILSYSHYKGRQTCKMLTGVSPSGNITFISKCYGGRATDSAIFKQSNLMNLLEPGDAVMVDRGFLIDEICEVNRWKCIRPPFLKDKKQFSKEESILTAKIAKARVHIERSNQRIKTFKIFGSVMPVSLVPLIEDISIVICAVINMSSPIISDSKFRK